MDRPLPSLPHGRFEQGGWAHRCLRSLHQNVFAYERGTPVARVGLSPPQVPSPCTKRPFDLTPFDQPLMLARHCRCVTAVPQAFSPTFRRWLVVMEKSVG